MNELNFLLTKWINVSPFSYLFLITLKSPPIRQGKFESKLICSNSFQKFPLWLGEGGPYIVVNNQINDEFLFLRIMLIEKLKFYWFKISIESILITMLFALFIEVMFKFVYHYFSTRKNIKMIVHPLKFKELKKRKAAWAKRLKIQGEILKVQRVLIQV
jgi:hypothetical protein